jgi:CBS domain-containing protein
LILDIKVGGIAKRPLTTVDENTPVSSATRTMSEHGIGSLGVTRDGRIVGIVTERDLINRVLAEGRDPKVTTVKEVMTQDLIAVDVEAPLREALDLMNRRSIRRMLVMERG